MSASPCKICRPTWSGTSLTIRSAGSSKTSCSTSGGDAKKVSPTRRTTPISPQGTAGGSYPQGPHPKGLGRLWENPPCHAYAAPGSNHHMEIFAVLDA